MLSQNQSLKIHEVKEILFNTGKKLKGDSKHRKINAFKAVEEVVKRRGGQA